jgi:ATP-binding cassette subfamily B protein
MPGPKWFWPKWLSPDGDPQGTLVLVWRLLNEFGFVRWKPYALAFTLMAIGAVCTSLTAYLIGYVINQAGHQNFTAVVEFSLLCFGVFALRGAAAYSHAVIMSRIGNAIVAENQRRLFSKLLQHNLGFFAERHTSEFVTQLAVGAMSATRVLDLLVGAVGRDLFTLIGLVGVMAVQDPLMSFFALVIAPPVVISVKQLTRRIRGLAGNQWTGGVRTMQTMQEMLQGLRIVKAFTLEPELQTRFDANVRNVEAQSNKMARVGQRVTPLMETLAGLAITAVMIYAGYRVTRTGSDAGEFMSFITAFLLAYEPAKRLARLNIDLTAALTGVRMLYGILDAPPTEPADDDRPPLAAEKARVEFRRVNFAYPGKPSVFRDLSFVAEAEQVTALVGHSGAGKSTIFNLLLRFYEIGGGSITIDGQDIAAVSRRSLRQHIAFVGQDVFLFHGSIRDNIAFGKTGASEADIIAAAKAAHAHDFIMSFPSGYDTQVGEHGLRLSGGERQRIAIARALIKNAPIILLDEATAALDSESEHHVQQAISELCSGRTTIAIAHRLSTIMHADRILVIESGKVMESGRHDELLRTGGRYASFYRMQLERQTTPAAAE